MNDASTAIGSARIGMSADRKWSRNKLVVRLVAELRMREHVISVGLERRLPVLVAEFAKQRGGDRDQTDNGPPKEGRVAIRTPCGRRCTAQPGPTLTVGGRGEPHHLPNGVSASGLAVVSASHSDRRSAVLFAMPFCDLCR